jgi:hypothetical protein
MAERDVFLLTMRRPGSSGIPGDEGAGPLAGSEEASLPEGGAADVDSFPGAVRVAAAFYGRGNAGQGNAGRENAVPAASVRASSPGASGSRAEGAGPRAVRHPLVALLLGTLGIMWFSVRRPGRPAWIDHDTGEVWAADRVL